VSPRATRSQGRPDTPVIPTDWGTSHAPVVEKTMPGTVALRLPGGTPGGFDTETQQTGLTPHAAYATVACRIQALAGEARVVATADDEETSADYLIAVPRSVHQVREGHLGKVTDTGDPALDGRTLSVVQVARGTHRFERDLFCTLID
jgi:hypothetical protein